MKFIALALCLITVFGAACADNGGGIKGNMLFENGASEYSIVYPDERTDAEEYAASVLQDYIFRISGARLKIKQSKFVNDGDKIISVGATDALKKSGVMCDYAALKGDGFFIKTAGNGIYIDGGNERGKLYGVYEFLDKYLGVKFLTYDYTYVPVLSEYEVGKIDDVQTPSFKFRNFMIAGCDSNREFLSQMRFVNEYLTIPDKFGGNLGWFKTADIQPTHNSLSYVSKDYASRFPEMFSFSKGEPVEICQTYGITENGEIDEAFEISPIKLAIESLKKFVLSSGSDVKYFMFGQQDVQTPCKCARCLADAEKYGRGGINVRFVNLLAREVQKWADAELGGREVNVLTFAYQYSEEAPVYVDANGKYLPIDETVVPENNVYIRLATYFAESYYSFTDERQIAKYRNLFASWSAITDKFMVWDYHINYYNYFNYYPTMQTWKDNLKLYKDIGVEYVLMQSAQNEKVGWQHNLEAYVASKLMWNVDRDVDELVDEFMTYYYGIAKDYMTRFKFDYDLYYRTLFDRFSDFTLVLGTDNSNGKYFDISFLNSQENLIDGAIDFVTSSDLGDYDKQELVKKLAVARASVRFMKMHNYNNYYFDKQSEYRAYVDEVLAELSALGFTRYSEGSMLNDYKINHGIR